MSTRALPPLPDEAEVGSVEYETLQWCEEKLRVGRLFVEESPGYDRVSAAMDAIFAQESKGQSSYVPTPSSSLSQTQVNYIAKIAEDIVSMLTDTKVFWDYKCRNPKYQEQARQANNRASDWYTDRLIDQRIADAIRYYTTSGTGYLHMYYSRRTNDIAVDAEDPRCVFPIEPNSYHDMQEALGVIIRKPRTPSWVEMEYGKKVAPDVGDPGIFGWFRRVIGGSTRKNASPLTRRKNNDDDAIPATPTVFVNTMYLDDRRTNTKDKLVYMGDWDFSNPENPSPKNQWSYTVAPGAPLFPFKRLVVWTTRTVLYDGPSPFWHGMFPVVKLTLNPWPKVWLGKAPLWDLLPLNASMNGLLRVVDDHAAQVAQPGVIADRNVSRTELNKFNSRSPGYQIRTNLSSGKGITIVDPPPLDQSLWQHIQWIETTMKYMAGTADVSQFSALNQLPSDDTIETMMKAMTPGIRLRSRILEGVMVQLARMFLFNIAEFDTITKRMARFGPDAMTAEDFDYDPNTFVPDSVPDGTPGDIGSTMDALLSDNPLPRYERARLLFESFSFNFKPGSLLNSAAQQDLMEDFLLAKMGYLSVFTLMERMGRMNFAPPGLRIPSSELERLALQQQLGIGMIANAQGRKATNQAPPSVNPGSDGSPIIQTS